MFVFSVAHVNKVHAWSPLKGFPFSPIPLPFSLPPWLEKNFTLDSFSFGLAALTFCLPGATPCSSYLIESFRFQEEDDLELDI